MHRFLLRSVGGGANLLNYSHSANLLLPAFTFNYRYHSKHSARSKAKKETNRKTTKVNKAKKENKENKENKEAKESKESNAKYDYEEYGEVQVEYEGKLHKWFIRDKKFSFNHLIEDATKIFGLQNPIHYDFLCSRKLTKIEDLGAAISTTKFFNTLENRDNLKKIEIIKIRTKKKEEIYEDREERIKQILQKLREEEEAKRREKEKAEKIKMKEQEKRAAQARRREKEEILRKQQEESNTQANENTEENSNSFQKKFEEKLDKKAEMNDIEMNDAKLSKILWEFCRNPVTVEKLTEILLKKLEDRGVDDSRLLIIRKNPHKILLPFLYKYYQKMKMPEPIKLSLLQIDSQFIEYEIEKIIFQLKHHFMNFLMEEKEFNFLIMRNNPEASVNVRFVENEREEKDEKETENEKQWEKRWRNNVNYFCDLKNPHLWYPRARQMKRNFIIHLGPTNSGKTYSALEELKKSGSGVYCGPLRLLAHEIYEKLESEGVPCSLITGQQRKLHPDSSHLSCTIEMCPLKEWDTAVIDEIQMIHDPNRGWAWTRLILGIEAKTIHICGAEISEELLLNLIGICNDNYVINKYERLSPLLLPNFSLSNLSQLKKGDCLIAFSRKEIYEFRNLVQKQTGLECAIIYGKLPPEIRSQQANLFNSKNNNYDVLIASDAIGMGLNLNIKRIIFSTLKKFDGDSDRILNPTEIKQIAGRAGRFNSDFPIGEVISFSKKENRIISNAINATVEQIPFAYIFPEYEQIELFTISFTNAVLNANTRSPRNSANFYFSDILLEFSTSVILDNSYLLARITDLYFIAKYIDKIPLLLIDRYQFCCAPIPYSPRGKTRIVDFFTRYVQKYSQLTSPTPIPPKDSYGQYYEAVCQQHFKNPDGMFYKPHDIFNDDFLNPDKEYFPKDSFVPVGIDRITKIPKSFDNSEIINRFLNDYEEIHQILDLYIWLSWRFPKQFTQAESALLLQQECENNIEHCLTNLSFGRKRRRNSKKPDWFLDEFL